MCIYVYVCAYVYMCMCMRLYNVHVYFYVDDVAAKPLSGLPRIQAVCRGAVALFESIRVEQRHGPTAPVADATGVVGLCLRSRDVFAEARLIEAREWS